MSVQAQLSPESLGGTSALVPLDMAAEYLRIHPWRVLPLYVVAMGPFSAAMLLAIGVVSSQHRSAVPETCVWLTAATIWRWGWIAVVQRRVQHDLKGEPPGAVVGRLLPILLVRLVSNFAILWGGVLLIPAFYGLFLWGLAAPMLLEDDRPAWARTKATVTWIRQATGRLTRVCLSLLGLGLLLLVSVVAVQLFVVHVLLPSFLGLESADAVLTVQSRSWFLCLCYFVFVVLDLYWIVLSVMLFYDLQARRLGTDLFVRLRRLQSQARES